MTQKLGFVNFEELDGYIINGENLFLFQKYLNEKSQRAIASCRTIGILNGGKVVWVAGFTFKVEETTLLFPDGTVATYPETQFNVAAANPANPRFDRVEIGYSLIDGQTVINIMHEEKIFDKIITPVVTLNVGVAAGAPVAPNLTVGKLSLGIISIPAAAAVLSQASVDQSINTAFSGSTFILSNTSLLRHNNTTGALEVTFDSGVTWNQVANVFKNKLPSQILNNQVAATSLVGAIIDRSISKFFRVEMSVFRKTSTTVIRAIGFIFCIYNDDTASWEITPQWNGTEPEVELSATQIGATDKFQISYTSSSLGGIGYQGSSSFTIKDL